jgi:hypothetical protein
MKQNNFYLFQLQTNLIITVKGNIKQFKISHLHSVSISIWKQSVTPPSQNGNNTYLLLIKNPLAIISILKEIKLG